MLEQERPHLLVIEPYSHIYEITPEDERYEVIASIAKAYQWIATNRDNLIAVSEEEELPEDTRKTAYYAAGMQAHASGIIDDVYFSIGPSMIPINGRHQDHFKMWHSIKAGVGYTLEFEYPFNWMVRHFKLKEDTALEIGKYIFENVGLPDDFVKVRKLTFEVEIGWNGGNFLIIPVVTYIDQIDYEDEKPFRIQSQEMTAKEIKYIQQILEEYINRLQRIVDDCKSIAIK